MSPNTPQDSPAPAPEPRKAIRRPMTGTIPAVTTGVRPRVGAAGAGLAGVGLAAALVLTGCAADAAGTAGGTPAAAAGGNPFDIYLAEDVDTIIVAQDTLRFQCMVDNGYRELEVFVSRRPGTPSRASVDQLTTENAFFASPADAAARGLRPESMGPPGDKLYVHDDAFETISAACDTTAWAALGQDAHQTYLDYRQLGNRLGATAISMSGELVRLQQETARCLLDAGEPVTPAQDQLFGITPGIELGQPVEYPERTGPKQGSGVEIIPAAEEIPYVPTPAEAELAVKYYECSVQTGARDEFDALLREEKTQQVAEHETELDELNPRIREMARKAAGLSGR